VRNVFVGVDVFQVLSFFLQGRNYTEIGKHIERQGSHVNVSTVHEFDLRKAFHFWGLLNRKNHLQIHFPYEP